MLATERRRADLPLSGRCPDRQDEVVSEPALTPSRRHRLEVRVTPEQGALIREATDLEDTIVSAFVLETVTTRATAC